MKKVLIIILILISIILLNRNNDISNDIIRFSTDAKIDDIAMALNVPIESVIDLCDKKYILLDRVLGDW